MNRIFKAALAVPVVAGVVTLANGSPALAAGAGATPGGHSTIAASSKPPTAPFCIASTSSNNSITLYNYGTVQTATGSYRGPFTASIGFGQIYFGPDGVYTNPGCRMAVAPNPIVPVTSASIAVGWTGAAPALNPTLLSRLPMAVGTIPTCTGLTGNFTLASAVGSSYSRLTNAYVVKIAGNCTVDTGVSTPTSFEFSGIQSPCPSDITTVDNCGTLPNGTNANDTEFVGAYTQQ